MFAYFLYVRSKPEIVADETPARAAEVKDQPDQAAEGIEGMRSSPEDTPEKGFQTCKWRKTLWPAD